jgi:hypothetical protein
MHGQRRDVITRETRRRRLDRVISAGFGTTRELTAADSGPYATPEDRALARDRVLFWAARSRKRR